MIQSSPKFHSATTFSQLKKVNEPFLNLKQSIFANIHRRHRELTQMCCKCKSKLSMRECGECHKRTCDDCDHNCTLIGNGLTGIRNLGNTCYMTAAFQCLSRTTLIRNYILHSPFQHHINLDNPLGTNGETVRNVHKLLKDLWHPENPSYIDPSNIAHSLFDVMPMFDPYTQHDSQEFLQQLLDNLHEDVNVIKKKPYFEIKPRTPEETDHDAAVRSLRCWHARNDSAIGSVITSLYKSSIQCSHCSFEQTTFEPFTFHTVAIPEKGDLPVKVFLSQQTLGQRMLEFDFLIPRVLEREVALVVLEKASEVLKIPKKNLRLFTIETHSEETGKFNNQIKHHENKDEESFDIFSAFARPTTIEDLMPRPSPSVRPHLLSSHSVDPALYSPSKAFLVCQSLHEVDMNVTCQKITPKEDKVKYCTDFSYKAQQIPQKGDMNMENNINHEDEAFREFSTAVDILVNQCFFQGDTPKDNKKSDIHQEDEEEETSLALYPDIFAPHFGGLLPSSYVIPTALPQLFSLPPNASIRSLFSSTHELLYNAERNWIAPPSSSPQGNKNSLFESPSCSPHKIGLQHSLPAKSIKMDDVFIGAGELGSDWTLAIDINPDFVSNEQMCPSRFGDDRTLLPCLITLPSPHNIYNKNQSIENSRSVVDTPFLEWVGKLLCTLYKSREHQTEFQSFNSLKEKLAQVPFISRADIHMWMAIAQNFMKVGAISLRVVWSNASCCRLLRNTSVDRRSDELTESIEVSLEALLDSQAKEVLDSKNVWTCENCKQRGGSKSHRVFAFNDIAFIYLMRFSNTETGVVKKVGRPVHVPFNIPLGNHAEHCPTGHEDFEAYFVIAHVGALGSGHYWGYAKEGGQWWEFDDDKVQIVTDEKEVMANAYIVAFKRVKPLVEVGSNDCFEPLGPISCT